MLPHKPRRELTERFVIVGLSIAIMSVGMWLWSVMGGGDDYMRVEAIRTMVWGLFLAGVANSCGPVPR